MGCKSSKFDETEPSQQHGAAVAVGASMTSGSAASGGEHRTSFMAGAETGPEVLKEVSERPYGFEVVHAEGLEGW